MCLTLYFLHLAESREILARVSLVTFLADQENNESVPCLRNIYKNV